MKTMMVFALMGASDLQVLTMLAVAALLLAAVVALGLASWWETHSFLGWFVRVVAAIVGGVLSAIFVGNMVPVASGPVSYLALIFPLLGGWLAVWIVNRWR